MQRKVVWLPKRKRSRRSAEVRLLLSNDVHLTDRIWQDIENRDTCGL